MSEPLVTRNPEIHGGLPCLRGTRIPVGTLQRGLDAWGMQKCRYQYPGLGAFTDRELLEAATYPRIEQTIRFRASNGDDVEIQVDHDGVMYLDGSLVADDIPRLTTALEDTASVLRGWKNACDQWEKERTA